MLDDLEAVPGKTRAASFCVYGKGECRPVYVFVKLPEGGHARTEGEIPFGAD